MSTPQDRAITHARTNIKNPITAIRAFCIECMGGYVDEIERCTAPRCPLFPYRYGKDPARSERERVKAINRGMPLGRPFSRGDRRIESGVKE